MKRKFIVLAVLIAVLLSGVVVAYPATRWRLMVIGMKAEGQLETVSWMHLLRMLRPDSGISLGSLATSGNPFIVIRNPRGSNADKKRGMQIFEHQCAQCHGNSASGGEAPPLVARELSHGDSDWALFITISQGVPGTPMKPSGLADDDVWRVISYIRGLGNAHEETDEIDGNASPQPIRETTYAMLRAASNEAGNWLLASGSYDNQRFSKDRDIDAKNVSMLGVQWIHQFETKGAVIESVPIVIDGRMYVTLPMGTVMALDARSGEQLWIYRRPPPEDIVVCCAQNRGVAVLGNRVYVGTLDAHLLALDASDGKLIWDQIVANYHSGYSITSPPLVLDGLIVTGIAGGDFPTRGFIAAYDSKTGQQRWRFNTIPEVGEPGNNTWKGDSWRTGGVATWMTGSFDPDLNLIYWGTGNPTPDFDANNRQGDNLYSNSVVALNASTGKLVWYFQYTPGDDHDWDAVQTPILIDANENGTSRKLLVVANRNGFFYVLDRQTGKFLRASPYVRQTWAIGITPEGRPIKNPTASLSPRGTLIYPGMSGGTNAGKSTYNPQTGFYYVPAIERSGIFFEDSPEPEDVDQQVGGAVQPLRNERHYTAVRAIDPATAKVRWDYQFPLRSRFFGTGAGLLSTAGGLVFGSDMSKFFALDAEDGKLLWSIETGGTVSSAPVTYRVDGRQYVAIVAGDVLLALALPKPSGLTR